MRNILIYLQKSKRNKIKEFTYKPWFGKHLSIKHKISLSKAFKGEKNPQWLGGKSFEPYGLAFNKELKEFIRARDGYRCQECSTHQSKLFSKNGRPKKLACHHCDYDKHNNHPSNLISLCTKCHYKTNFKRKDWTTYFQKKLLEVKKK